RLHYGRRLAAGCTVAQEEGPAQGLADGVAPEAGWGSAGARHCGTAISGAWRRSLKKRRPGPTDAVACTPGGIGEGRRFGRDGARCGALLGATARASPTCARGARL